MTNEEMLAKLENATEDETLELLEKVAESTDTAEEELSESDLEEVAGGVRYINSVSGLYNYYNRLSPALKKKLKAKLNELLKKIIRFGKVAMPF